METSNQPWSIDEVRRAVLELNQPQLPFAYRLDGDTVKATWKFDDPTWAPRLEASRGASADFSYSVRLKAGKATFRWFEQDAGLNNGRYRAYRGYSRGFSINLFTIIVWLVQRLSRPPAAEPSPDSSADHLTRAQLKAPLLELLDRAGWKNKGVTV
jgi:hypothetical protein